MSTAAAKDQQATHGRAAAALKTPSGSFPARPRSGKPNTLARSDQLVGGFTLVELLVVLVIASLVLTLVGTSISRSISGAEMRVAARKMTAALRYTRTRAILDKQEKVFLVDTEKRQYLAPKKDVVELPEGMNVALTTARSELTAESVGGIRFYPDGGSTGGFVELETNGRVYRIDVAWLTGEASLQLPEN